MRFVAVAPHDADCASRCCVQGAALEGGDIEDCGSVACVRCPWHGRRVALRDGREVRIQAGHLQLSADPVQRVHAVTRHGGFVWVTPAADGGAGVASDRFNCVGGCAPAEAGPSATTAQPATQWQPEPHALPAQLLAAAAAHGASPARPAPLAPEASSPGLVPYAGFGASPARLGGAGGAAGPAGDDVAATRAAAAVLLPFAGAMPLPAPPPPVCAAALHAPLSPANLLKSAGFRARKAAATEAVAAKPTQARSLFADPDPVARLAAAADAALHGAPRHALTVDAMEF